ncbi:hypothetical protein [Hymenobacter canadensis]|uniref:Uncharacterized protein n=1 Tax=Hymenobacter canadensis TaxID=2999067 RepID=A0ABY7LRY6_9BACT|nr:hypothetical protein [Hymenobacter canadensis]WBA43176.1 hypothetical protein O3303_06325 [Hymenobacter canadensis]
MEELENFDENEPAEAVAILPAIEETAEGVSPVSLAIPLRVEEPRKFLWKGVTDCGSASKYEPAIKEQYGHWIEATKKKYADRFPVKWGHTGGQPWTRPVSGGLGAARKCIGWLDTTCYMEFL